jgi:hypothetical protein
MRRSDNVKFAEKYGVLDDFQGVCRFEMNLNTKEQIRSALGVSDNGLMSVLSADANPILDYLKEVISPPEIMQVKDKKTYISMLVLKDNDYDLAKVEAKMREFHPRGTSISKLMETYRAVLAQTTESDAGSQYQNLISSLS